MTAKITRENKKFIKIGYYKMIPVILETLLHESLKYSYYIHEPNKLSLPIYKNPTGNESCEVVTFRTNADLMVCLSLV